MGWERTDLTNDLIALKGFVTHKSQCWRTYRTAARHSRNTSDHVAFYCVLWRVFRGFFSELWRRCRFFRRMAADETRAKFLLM